MCRLVVDRGDVLVEEVFGLDRSMLSFAAEHNDSNRSVSRCGKKVVHLVKDSVPHPCEHASVHVERVVDVFVVTSAVIVVRVGRLPVLWVYQSPDVQDDGVLDGDMLKGVGEVDMERVFGDGQVVLTLVAFPWCSISPGEDVPPVWTTLPSEDLGLFYCVAGVVGEVGGLKLGEASSDEGDLLFLQY